MEMYKLVPSSNDSKLSFSPSARISSPSKQHRRLMSSTFFARRKCLNSLYIAMLFGICFLAYLYFFTNVKENHADGQWQSKLDNTFWDQLVAPEYCEVLNSTANVNKLFLLEPYVLANVYVTNGTSSHEEQIAKWNSLRYLQSGRFWDWQSNRLTVGIFDEHWSDELDFGSFKEMLRITDQANRTDAIKDVNHVFYQNTNPDLPWAIPLYLHLVVLHRDQNAILWTAPIPHETQTHLQNNGITLNLPQYEKIYSPSSFNLTSIDGIRLPANIPNYLSETILSPGIIHDRVRYVDEQLRQLANRFVAEVKQDSVGEEHISKAPSSFESSKKISLNTVQELERATHFSIDIDQPCGGNLGRNLSLVVVVMNRVTDFARRQVIRDTYGSALKQNNQTAIYFMVAKSNDSNVELKIRNESSQYNDLIQVDYLEHYYNLTVKSVALLRWTSLHCQYSRYVLKFDDDSFIRVNPLLSALEHIEPTSIMGLLSPHSYVNRDKSSKWYISPSDYPNSLYPKYNNGVYLVPGRLAIRLYEAVISEPRNVTIPALQFEDVYITGILATKANIPRAHLRCMYNYYEVLNRFWNNVPFCIIFNQLSSTKIKSYWDKFGAN